MKQEIAIKYCNGILVPTPSAPQDRGYSVSFMSNLMSQGFIPNEELAEALDGLSKDELEALHNQIMPIIKKMVGSKVKHKPMYPNFPKQVMEASDAQLYWNAMAHYWSFGHWLPNFTVENRPVGFEDIEFRELGRVTESDLDNVFTQILKSADSISETSKNVLKWFVTSGRKLIVPDSIPFKENLCVLAGLYLDNNMWDDAMVRDTNDVLRIVTYINGGDVSLAENTKFKSLPRKTRKVLIKALERVAKEEDFVMHRNKWIKLFHNLHVGEYSQKLFAMAKKLRENEKIETFNGKLEEALQCADAKTAVKLLATRPGVFARHLTQLVAMDKTNMVINSFAGVVDQVPTRNLAQLWGSLKTRVSDVDKRVVFPKGMVQRAYVLRNHLARLPETKVNTLIDMIKGSLVNRFSDLEELGNVYIDPGLYECPLPTQMRSASESLREVARGTRLPIGEKDTLRFFIYWKGQDIDLSATFHDEDFNLVSTVAYYDLRNGDYGYHSGDVTRAPNGASEFIDINIPKALASKKNIRYLAMDVRVFSGPTFAEHEICFAGWMTRNKPNSNEIFEPKTVQQKVDVRAASRNVVPVLFDLVERKAIWADITGSSQGFGDSRYRRMFHRGGNNVENNKATIRDMVEAFVSLDNKITLGDLFELHAKARGTLVENKEEADFVYSTSEGDVTPFDITAINADYLK